MKHTVIIGNGITGVTTARNVRKNCDHRITIISGESDHFFSRTALMYVYMGHMPMKNTKPYEDNFWAKNKIELKRAFVNRIDTSTKKIFLDDHSEMNYDQLVIASGSHPVMGDWHGKHFEGVQGLVSQQDLAKMEETTKGIQNAVVVGGGLIGIELVEMLRSRGINVTYIVREFKFWNRVLPEEESAMVEKHIREHHIDLRLGTELQEILGNENGKVRAIKTDSGEEIPAEFVGIAIGVNPNIHFLEGSGIKINRGILINEFLETNIPDVYAAGDCAEFEFALPGRLKIEQIWYTGRMHGESLGRTVAGKRTPYKPINFFNSAKLLDIEFQVYSRTVVIPESDQSFFWKSDDDKKSIRIFFDPKTEKFEGVTLLGIRYRHEVCDRWLRENRSVDYVMEHLSDANFDPEFYKHHEMELLSVYNKKYNKKIVLKKRNLKFLLKSLIHPNH